MLHKLIEITLAQDGIDNGQPNEVKTPVSEGLVVSYIGLAIIIASFFFVFRRRK